jgi:hypothetical protein
LAALWTFVLAALLAPMLTEGLAYVGTIQGSHPICGKTPPFHLMTPRPGESTIGLATDITAPDLEALFCAQHALAPAVVKSVDAAEPAIFLALQTGPVIVVAKGTDAPAAGPSGPGIEREQVGDGLVVLRRLVP